ncbi:hypothetical protein HK102_009182 [Quaeritorhiza haematococci]|nr:hypothetical protein HK102_009182 [Quaeritorhiza haematococci]
MKLKKKGQPKAEKDVRPMPEGEEGASGGAVRVTKDGVVQVSLLIKPSAKVSSVTDVMDDYVGVQRFE